MSVPPRSPRPPLAIPLGLGLALALALNGCDQPTGSTRPKSKGPATEVVEQAPTPPPAEPKRELIVGKTTQEIGNAAEKQPGAVDSARPRITARDPITLQGNAYVVAMGQTAINNIKHALDLYQAETGEYPRTYEEFMEKIIKANNIALPKLPPYQEYVYDAPTHQLLVREFPDRR